MSDDRFSQAEAEFFRLKGQLDAGYLTRAQFESMLETLMIQDAEGRYWSLGPDSGKWYVHDGTHWVEGDPARPTTPPAVHPPNIPSPAPPAPASVPVAQRTRLPLLIALAGGLLPVLALVAIVFFGGIRVIPYLESRIPTVAPVLAPTPTTAPTERVPTVAPTERVPTAAPMLTRIPTAAPAETRNACGYQVGPTIYDKWIEMGGESGFLGCPTADEAEAAASPQGTTGRYIQFSKGDGGFIVAHRTGALAGQAFEVHGCMFKLYSSIGAMQSRLGYPVSDEFDIADGRRSDFEGGSIDWNAQTSECRMVSR